MAEYYSNSTSRKKSRRRRVYSGKELALLLLDAVATLAMVVLIFSTVAIILCQHISPEKSGILSVMALGAPIIYLLDIVVMLYWVVRWRWYRASAMIVMVMLGFFYISRYYKVVFDREYDVKYNEREYVKVMTYNVLEGKKPELLDYIKAQKPDILCVQEMTIGCDNWNALTETYKSTYKPNVGTGGNQILSKYKILRSGDIGDLPRRTATWADLLITGDTVRVVSLHLQSTAIRPEDTQFLESHEYIHDKERESKMRSIVSRLTENNRERAKQADCVAEFLAQTPYKTIVCGDFNDVPLSYTYQTIAGDFDDAFSQKANGFAYTYNTKYRLLRIDHILVTPSIEVASYKADTEIELSDHYPVISRLKIEPNI